MIARERIDGDRLDIEQLCTLLGGERQGNTCIVSNNFKNRKNLDGAYISKNSLKIDRIPLEIYMKGEEKPVIVYYSNRLPLEEHCNFIRYIFIIDDTDKYRLVIVPGKIVEGES
ncbi:MAG: hypothetical protein GXO26_08030 [Crenarchaeota archaeon]|nr:hypothetical protein [Thermoproteota archaeon]